MQWKVESQRQRGAETGGATAKQSMERPGNGVTLRGEARQRCCMVWICNAKALRGVASMRVDSHSKGMAARVEM